MATHRRMSPKFWQDPKVRRWSDQEKLLAQYLMTCSHRTTEGLFWLPKQYAAVDLGWSFEGVSKGFQRLISDGFIAYDDGSETILLLKALRYQAPAGEKQLQGAINTLVDVPPSPLFALLREAADEFAPQFGEALAEALTSGPLKGHGSTSGAPSEGYRPSTPSPTPSPTTSVAEVAMVNRDSGKTETTSGGREYPDDFEATWAEYPRKVAKPAAFKAWRSRRRERVPVEELHQAVANYAEVCRKSGKTPEHILHGATFFGPNERWRDYRDDGEALAEVRRLPMAGENPAIARLTRYAD